MPPNADATVTLGVIGKDALARAAHEIGEAWRSAGQKISNSAREFGRDLQNSLKSAAGDAVSVATSASRISFAAGAQSARELGIAVQRAAVASGRDVETLRAQIEKISKGSLMSDKEALALSESLRGVTYDAKFATDSVQAIADEAEALGQSPQQVARFAESLHNTEGVTSNLAKAMGEVDEVAHRLRIDPRQLHDQIAAADGILVRFKTNAKEAAELLGNLGKGLSPERQKSAQQNILSTIAGNRVGYERMLRGAGLLKKGESILNEEGEIADPAGLIRKINLAREKKFGKKRAAEVARMTYGDIEGNAISKFGTTPQQISEADAGPQMTAEIKARMVRESEQGQQIATELQRQRNEIAAGGKIAKETSGVNKFLADNPTVGYVAGPAATYAAPKVAGAVAAKLGIGGTAATVAGVSVGLVGAAAMLPGDTPGVNREAIEEEYLRSGKSRLVDHWYGATLEPVPPEQQAQAAQEYAVKHIADALSNMPINLTIQQNQDGTIAGVKNGKESAASQ